MSTSQLMHYASLALFCLGSAYLVYRSVDVLVRQIRSYRAIPYPTRDTSFRGERGAREVGAMVGIALGDALGQFRESLPVWLSRLRYGRAVGPSRGIIRFGRKRGAVTDDTQLTLAVARSIDDHGAFQVDQFRQELASWWRYRIGPGRATTKAVSRLRAGVVESGDASSQGNGAAMRVVPLALASCDDVYELQRSIEQCSRPTHAAQEAIAGAQIVGLMTLRCLGADSAKNIASLLDADELMPMSTQASERWSDILERALQPSRGPAESVATLRDIGTSGWVFESVPAAIHMLVTFSRDWRRGLEALFQVGGDVDTIAALYCSWVGALHGPDIFGDLLDGIQGTGKLADEARRIRDIQ